MNEAKKARILLVILYLSFISLGLPDAVLGSAWPNMRHSFSMPLEAAGILQSMTTILSVLSSLAAGWLLLRWSTGLLIAVCAVMTGSAMYGYSFAPSWYALLFFTIFFGLGQGAVDTAVNSYMAKHYSAKHMNWVHCCWGIGATAGPFIMTSVFAMDYTWRAGYLSIAVIQTVLAVIFLSTRGLWEKEQLAPTSSRRMRPSQVLRMRQGELSKGRLYTTATANMLFYFLYAGVELVPGLWSASYLVDELGATPASAAVSVTMFWGAIAVGRFLGGFVANRLPAATLLRLGLLVAVVGACLFAFSTDLQACRIALLLIGLGIASMYPTMMHDTPSRVGKKWADKVVGFQVGAALVGNSVLPLLFGYIARAWSLRIFGVTVVMFAILVLIAHEVSYRFSLMGNPVEKA